MDTRNITRYIDLVFCLLLLPAMIMLLPLERWLNSDPIFVTLLLVWLYTIYVVHRAWTVPALFGERNRPLLALTILLVSLVATYLLTRYQLSPPKHFVEHFTGAAEEMAPRPDRAPRGSGGRLSVNVQMQQQAVWFLYVVVTTFSIVVALLSELNRQMMMRQSVEFEKKRAELSLYKAQINPHFLFNTLNTLLGLVVTKSDKAEDAIVQFTALMRYMCNNSTQDHVALHTEIEYIEEYIALQRYRLSDHTEVRLKSSIDKASSGCQIAPMLLITFVENALKYGASSQFGSLIDIAVEVEEGIIMLVTENPIFAQHTKERGAGIGIENCRKRLELIYPGRYSLQIEEGADNYRATLTIKLQ
ncbi:MAG: histidine kinase [Rikenellaceae bacterium]